MISGTTGPVNWVILPCLISDPLLMEIEVSLALFVTVSLELVVCLATPTFVRAVTGSSVARPQQHVNKSSIKITTSKKIDIPVSVGVIVDDMMIGVRSQDYFLLRGRKNWGVHFFLFYKYCKNTLIYAESRCI